MSYTVNIYHCDWIKIITDWPIARQSKVRQESKTKIILGRRSAESESPTNMERSKMGMLYREKAQSHVTKQR